MPEPFDLTSDHAKPEELPNDSPSQTDPVICTAVDDPCDQWSTQQIENWTRVTMRIANKAAMQEIDKQKCKDKRSEILQQQKCKEIRSEIIQQRWATAKANIPKSLHRGLGIA